MLARQSGSAMNAREYEAFVAEVLKSLECFETGRVYNVFGFAVGFGLSDAFRQIPAATELGS